MRGNRAFLLVTAHLLFLSLLAGVIYLIFRTSYPTFRSYEDQRIFSKLVFSVLVIFELVVVTFISPALSAGSFSMERERRTFDLLRVTSLSPASLVVGKFFSAIFFVFLLLLTSIPTLSPAFIVGGVAGVEIFLSYTVLSACTIAFCSIGIFISSLVSRTLVANVLTYACAVFLMFGIPILLVTTLVIMQTGNLSSGEELSQLAISTWLAAGLLIVSLSPLASLIAAEFFIIEQNNIWMVDIAINENVTYQIISPWISSVLIYVLVAILLLWITVQRVKFGES